MSTSHLSMAQISSLGLDLSINLALKALREFIATRLCLVALSNGLPIHFRLLQEPERGILHSCRCRKWNAAEFGLANASRLSRHRSVLLFQRVMVA